MYLNSRKQRVVRTTIAGILVPHPWLWLPTSSRLRLTWRLDMLLNSGSKPSTFELHSTYYGSFLPLYEWYLVFKFHREFLRLTQMGVTLNYSPLYGITGISKSSCRVMCQRWWSLSPVSSPPWSLWRETVRARQPPSGRRTPPPSPLPS